MASDSLFSCLACPLYLLPSAGNTDSNQQKMDFKLLSQALNGVSIKCLTLCFQKTSAICGLVLLGGVYIPVDHFYQQLMGLLQLVKLGLEAAQ
jgi:hypothetical protein